MNPLNTHMNPLNLAFALRTPVLAQCKALHELIVQRPPVFRSARRILTQRVARDGVVMADRGGGAALQLRTRAWLLVRVAVEQLAITHRTNGLALPV